MTITITKLSNRQADLVIRSLTLTEILYLYLISNQ